MAKKTGTEGAAVNLRRMYVDCRYGQMHVRSAFASNGGFDELTPLVCLHEAPMSGRVFRSLLRWMGVDRPAYAPDLPGFGESDPPPGPLSVADHAAAIGDFLDQLRLRQVDLLGCQLGAAIAAELAIARPQQVRHVVMAAVPVFNEAEREAFRKRPWPGTLREDGSHLIEAWQRQLSRRASDASLEQVAADVAEALHNGPEAWRGIAAAMEYPAAVRLPKVSPPVLVLRPHDDFRDITPRAQGLLPQAKFVDLPEFGAGLFEAGADVVAGHLRAFLD